MTEAFVSNMTDPDHCHLLVIGYGNTLRADDGVGPRVADAVEAMGLPGVRTLVVQQLSPEHAAPVSQADAVVFVDAAVDAPQEVQLRPLEPGGSSQLMAHAADPRTLMALARDVFGRAPKAWWLTIPAVEMAFSETLSPAAQEGMRRAVEMIQSLRTELSSANHQASSPSPNPLPPERESQPETPAKPSP